MPARTAEALRACAAGRLRPRYASHRPISPAGWLARLLAAQLEASERLLPLAALEHAPPPTFPPTMVNVKSLLGRQPESYSRKKEYVFGPTLGEGTFGAVRLATRVGASRPHVAGANGDRASTRAPASTSASAGAAVPWSRPGPAPGPDLAPPPAGTVRTASRSFGARESHAYPGQRVAVKVIPKKVLRGHLDYVETEIGVLASLSPPHPHVVRLLDWFSSYDKYYLVFELADGGELFDCLVARGKFSERDAADLVRSVAGALEYLHAHGVVHRDVKPENILFRSKEQDADVVLVDFGIARALHSPGERLTSAAGSLGYAAPEILLGEGHGTPVDLWSLGVITYTLLCGYAPFRTDDPKLLAAETKAGRIPFHARHWDRISGPAKDFVQRCLTLDPTLRMTAPQALVHPWLAATGAQPTADISSALQANYRRRLRAAVLAVRAGTRMRHLAALARREDPDGHAQTAFEDHVSTDTAQEAKAEWKRHEVGKARTQLGLGPGDFESEDDGEEASDGATAATAASGRAPIRREASSDTRRPTSPVADSAVLDGEATPLGLPSTGATKAALVW